MDSFEFNKLAMAALGAVFIVMSLNFLSEGIFHSDKPEQPGYAIEVAETSGDAGGDDSGPAFEPLAPLLASADVSAGEREVKKCAACHTFEEGGANKVGPALYGVVNRAIASVDGFGYSSSLIAFGEGKSWTYEELNGFLWKPKTYVKGTSMGFAGVRDVEDRASIVAYLRSLAASPAPLPDVTETSAEGESAEGQAPEEATEETSGDNSEAQPEQSEDTSGQSEEAGDASAPEASGEAAADGENSAAESDSSSDAQPETDTTEEPAEEEGASEGNEGTQAQ